MRTQVAIVGAGPAGLVLSHLLHLAGVESVVLEARSREYVERRVRAGVLERGTADLLADTGVGDRMRREGMVHAGLELRFDGLGRRIDLTASTGGGTITVYGQQEIVKDLIAARLAAGGQVHFEVDDVRLDGLTTDTPTVRFTHEGHRRELRCAAIAGCDGFHGVSRASVPAGALRTFQRAYPYAWLGILAATPPSAEELIYAVHERGFALHSMRGPDVTRLYLQVDPDTTANDWPDKRVWAELHARLATADGFRLAQGPILERSIAGLRSFVVEPMRHGRLFLAGDAAHIVPATGAKGLNLAVADVRLLAEALTEWLHTGDSRLVDAYSDRCLRRVWRVQQFSWWMTRLLHQPPGDAAERAFHRRLQRAELEQLTTSPAAAQAFAENYVGLPMADPRTPWQAHA